MANNGRISCIGRKIPGRKGLFQYGNAVLPDGENASGLLAVSTVAGCSGLTCKQTCNDCEEYG